MYTISWLLCYIFRIQFSLRHIWYSGVCLKAIPKRPLKIYIFLHNNIPTNKMFFSQIRSVLNMLQIFQKFEAPYE